MNQNILKIEVIIQNIYLDKLLNLLEKKGVHGFSAFDIGRGKGAKQGEHMVEGLLPTTRWTFMFSIVEEETYKSMKPDLCQFLELYRASMIVVPVYDTYHISFD